MRAVKRTADGIAVVSVPAPSGDGARVRIRAAGICGSDLHLAAQGPSPVTLGHEVAGVLDDGTLVAVRPSGHCGICRHCRAGRTHLCREAFGRFLGIAVDGGLADEVVVPPDALYPVPRALSADGGALVEPIAVAVHGLRRASLEVGQRIAVVGAGAIGLAAVAVARPLGVEVDVAARHRHQELAVEALGGRVGLAGRYDVVIDAVGSQGALDAAIRACRSGGTLVELGMFWDPVLLGAELLAREITLVPAMLYAHRHDADEFALAVDVLSADPVIVPTLVTHRFSLDEAARAFEVAGDRASGAIKVHLVP